MSKEAITFVLDCSVTMAWCFEDEMTDFTESVLKSMQKAEVRVPAIWTLEVANVLLVAERKKRITPLISANFLSALQRFDIVVELNE